MMYNSERLGKLLEVTQLIGAQEQVCLIINQYHFFFFKLPFLLSSYPGGYCSKFSGLF